MAARSLTRRDLNRLFNAAVEAAGPRYTRAANVEVPIADAFEALLRTPTFFARFDELAREIDTRSSDLLGESSGSSEPTNRAAQPRRIGQRGRRLAVSLRSIQRDPVAELPLSAIARSARRLEADSDALAQELYEQLRLVSEGEAASAQKRLVEDTARRVNSVRSSAARIAAFCAGSHARVTNRGTLLLVGDAGQGKTHLFCDVVRRSLDDNRAAILLMGQHFRAEADVWDQVARQVRVSGLGGRGVLSALEGVGRRRAQRVLLLVDALNEGGGMGLWPQTLRQFLQTARSHPHLVIAISCRSSYVRAVIPRQVERSTTRFEHEGFSGVEASAMARFFSHYGLRHPSIPLLSPEFSRPLFLKLFCEGLQDRQRRTAPAGHRGMTDVLENFARSVGRRIVRSMGRPELTMLPWECLKELASHMAQAGVEMLDRPRAAAIAAAYVAGRVDAQELLQRMIDEGLLAEDLRYDNGRPLPVVRFPYQQFSDHLIARYLLRHHLDRRDPRRCFSAGGALAYLVADQFAIWRHSGLLQALAIQIPEWTTSELLDLVPARAHEELYRGHIQSVVWRKPDRFLDVPKVVGYLNEAARSSESLLSEAWTAMLTVAVIPSNPLNAQRLHASLFSRPLWARDASWSRFLHRTWEPGSVVDRYLEWSDTVDAKSLPDDVLLLAGVALTWFFTSSNRFIRDRATKALVRIMQGRFPVLTSLLDLFRAVNDPYVTERLVCAAYGCALLSSDAAALAHLARKVNAHYLSGSNRSRHILVRDYAEGVVVRAKALSPRLRVRTIRTRWAGARLRPPTRQRLAARYEQNRDYWDIWHSVMAQDDFDRYVIEPAVHQFTGYRLNERILRREPERPEPDPIALQVWLKQLTGEELTAEEQAVAQQQRPRTAQARDPKERFDVDVARRWIFARVLSLGWKPERFGEFDRMVNYRDMREARKPERIGKKYQWIGLHEVLGFLADNYRWHSQFRHERAARCPGGWAMNVRDIDPSHLPWSRPPEGRRPWWQPLRYALRPVAAGEIEPWIRSRYWPDPKQLILVTDSDGVEWLVTEGHYQWSDLDERRSGEDRYPYRTVWCQLRCYLVRSRHSDRMRKWLSRQDFMGRWMPESVSHHGDFIAEFPWHPSAREARQGWTRGWRGNHKPPVAVLIPVASLSWDDSFDASTKESYSGFVPSSWLAAELQASWQPPFDYATASGRIVAIDPSWHAAGPHVGLVRRREFEQVCRKLDVVPFWTLLGEKHVIEGLGQPNMGWREISGSFELAADDVVGSSRQKLETPRN